MNIILLNNLCKRKGSVEICLRSISSIALFGTVLIAALSMTAGYYLGIETTESGDIQTTPTANISQLLEADREKLLDEKARVQAHLDAMAIRLGSLQAQVLRLDALGDRLVDVAKLDKDEFDFSVDPAQGGLDATDVVSQGYAEITADIASFNSLLDDRVHKLDLLEELITTGQLYEEITPSGRPVVKGWLSSRFGKRIDPKTGKKTLHRGLDYAGKTGAEVIAVASGFVIRSEFQKGFGNMIEIKHPDGYSTVYAHNNKNLVEAGDMVRKGQQIAELGSTGRSTGPHVHFEVRRNGKYVNPSRFVKR